MGEANRKGVGPNSTLCSLQRFKLQSCQFSDSERLDLNLGLSLGGCYSQIPKDKPLFRASSLNGDLGLNEDDEGNGFISLARTSSLPAEGEQDLRKLKEKQAMKRMVAKRRMEKHRQSSRGGGVCEEEMSLWEPKLPNWATEAAATKNARMPSTAFYGAFQKFKPNVNSSANLKIEGPENPIAAKVYNKLQPTVSSRAAEHGKSIHPTNCCFKPVVDLGTMARGKSAYSPRFRSATAAITLDEMANGKPSEAAETEQEKPPKKVRLLANGVVDISTMEMMRLMPSVTTTGDGPNGMKIEGFLYRYLKGQVSIVCVCHGSFFSPAEFVKHAGGSGVGNPMKRINVLPVTL